MLTTRQTLSVKIIDLNYLGQGVAKEEGMIIFIDGAIPGDFAEIKIIEQKKKFAVGKLIKIITPSVDRINPPCEYYDDCGGCQMMHMSYEAQLICKKDRVINELKRASVNTEDVLINDTIGMNTPFNYRNKTTFSVSRKNNEIIIGPYEQGTYNTVDINNCMLQSNYADNVIALFKKLMKKYKLEPYDKNSGKGIIRNIVLRSNRQNDLMLIIVTAKEEFPNKDNLINDLKSNAKEIKTIVQNINDKKTNLAMGHKNIILHGKGIIEDYIGELKFAISPETFFQINPQQTEILYETAINYAGLSKDDICFDIYCGIGTISLMAAKHAKKVYGVEIVEQSIINAKENAVINNISNTEFYAGKAEEVIPRLYKNNIKADVVIVDPPRKGCEKEVIDTINDMQPKKIVYVSCNPSTLARDIKLLEAGGYKLKKVQPIDQFPWSVHVECVILMQNCGFEGEK